MEKAKETFSGFPLQDGNLSRFCQVLGAAVKGRLRKWPEVWAPVSQTKQN